MLRYHSLLSWYFSIPRPSFSVIDIRSSTCNLFKEMKQGKSLPASSSTEDAFRSGGFVHIKQNKGRSRKKMAHRIINRVVLRMLVRRASAFTPRPLIKTMNIHINPQILKAPITRSLCTERPSDREHGTVKWFDPSKGFGFLMRENGSDLFVHYTNIRGQGYRALETGQRVEFVIADSEKGPVAEDVTLSTR